MALGDPEALGDPVHIVEGVADALAVWARKPGLVLVAITRVHAILNRPGVLARLYRYRATIWPDQDGPGLESVGRLADELKAAGIAHATQRDDQHKDPADWAACEGWPDIGVDDFTETAGRFLDAGQPPAEADRLAVHLVTQGDQP